MMRSVLRWASAAILTLGAASTWAGCSSGGIEVVTACPTSQTTCDSVCVDTKSDAKNCGACGTACAEGEVCSDGACALTCSGGSTKCGASCVDTKNDPLNCGACDNACAAGEICNAGTCALSCVGGTTKCGTACVNTANDPQNCGSCGNACGTGRACLASACVVASPPPTTVTFPTTTSAVGTATYAGGTLGEGGSGMRFRTGDYVEQTYARDGSVSKLALDVRMSDATNSFCGAGTVLTWTVKLNGTSVGTYGWTQGGGDHQIAETYTFAPIAPIDGKVTIRLESLSTVCSGGGAWNWYPGGTATLTQ